LKDKTNIIFHKTSGDLPSFADEMQVGYALELEGEIADDIGAEMFTGADVREILIPDQDFYEQIMKALELA
jgi:hypothetical protein